MIIIGTVSKDQPPSASLLCPTVPYLLSFIFYPYGVHSKVAGGYKETDQPIGAIKFALYKYLQ